MTAPAAPSSGSWWDHHGALAVVFAGGAGSADGDLVLPVRLPQGAGRWARLEHYLSDPSAWHKVDLVRHQDPTEPGGWRYEAHLVVLTAPWASPGTLARRQAAAALDRRGAVDLNVSSVVAVSFDAEVTDVEVTTVYIDAGRRSSLEAARLAQRRANKAAERSRRANNAAHYELSRAQQRRAERRRAEGLRPVGVNLPKGPRVANAAGVPRSSYRKDASSLSYRRIRAGQAAAGQSRPRAKRCQAAADARLIVGKHGADLVVEKGNISHWSRLWGRASAATSPGMLKSAIATEARAVAALAGGGGLLEAATRPTAWTQHCLCGARVPKGLADRAHRCASCGLVAGRDATSAAVGSFTVFSDPSEPSTARVDYTRAAKALSVPGLQVALSESSASPSPSQQHRRRDGRAQASARKKRGAARRSAGATSLTTPDEEPAEPSLAVGDHVGASETCAGSARTTLPGSLPGLRGST